jgi:SRSO17 transposase
MHSCGDQDTVYAAQRWGLPEQVVPELADRLYKFWTRFRPCFKTKTHDTSPTAWLYLRGLLTMDAKRNFVNIARRVIDPHDDGQAVQQFMSDSPWNAQAVFDQIQAEIRQRPELASGMLTVDESGDERAGDQSAGAARQYLGRKGTVEMGQVGVALGYYTSGTWAMVDARLYLPEVWFDDAHARLRKRWHIPDDAVFRTKPQLALDMIRHARANGLPFGVVSCDSMYGQEFDFRAGLADEGLIYIADIMPRMYVYLTEPVVGPPAPPPQGGGKPPSRPRLLPGSIPTQVRDLPQHPAFALRRVSVRQTERGELHYECAAQRVWTVKGARVRCEWLLIRREPDGSLSYAVSNAPEDTPMACLALWRSQRYFAERIFEDAKSEGGWDELVARKYWAWQHHTALDAMALWFVAETRLDWAQRYPRDPALAHELEVTVLPALSMANVRALLQAGMPLPQMTQQDAIDLVVTHLVHRSQSTASRLLAQRNERGPT